MPRVKIDPVDRAVDMVLDLTIEQRNAFTVALRQIEKRMGALATPRMASEPKPKRAKMTPSAHVPPLGAAPEAQHE